MKEEPDTLRRLAVISSPAPKSSPEVKSRSRRVIICSSTLPFKCLLCQIKRSRRTVCMYVCFVEGASKPID